MKFGVGIMLNTNGNYRLWKENQGDGWIKSVISTADDYWVGMRVLGREFGMTSSNSWTENKTRMREGERRLNTY